MNMRRLHRPSRRQVSRYAAAPTAQAVTFTTGQYALGGAGDFAIATKALLVRWIPRENPPNANLWIAGTKDAAAGVALRCTTYAGSDRGIIRFFDGAFSDPYVHVPPDGEVDRYVVDVVVLDTAAGKLRHYRDGYQIGIGATSALASFTSAGAFGVNTRPSSGGTLQYGDLSVIEIQGSTTELTPAQVLAASRAEVGTALDGAAYRFLPSGISGSTWTDEVAAIELTLTGSPTVETVSLGRSGGIGLGGIECIGDSRTDGRDSLGSRNNGFRKALQDRLLELGYTCALSGQVVGGANATRDYDNRHTGVSSQALGVLNGAQVSRLSTLAADVAITVGPAGHTILEYGANDLAVRVDTNGQTAADAATAFLDDVDTAIGIIAGTRTGRIVICNILRQSTSASTSGVRSAIDLVNAGLPARIATQVGLGVDVVLADVCTAVTPTQADADDTGVLYDGIHETDASYAIDGRTIAEALVS